MYRVKDTKLVDLASQFEAGKPYLQNILNVELVKPEFLLDCDLIILGSPTYHGSISSKVATFLEEADEYWPTYNLSGKMFFPFTSAEDAEGNSDMCINLLNHYATGMGMFNITIPTKINSWNLHFTVWY